MPGAHPAIADDPVLDVVLDAPADYADDVVDRRAGLVLLEDAACIGNTIPKTALRAYEHLVSAMQPARQPNLVWTYRQVSRPPEKSVEAAQALCLNAPSYSSRASVASMPQEMGPRAAISAFMAWAPARRPCSATKRRL